jgi:hypothetical protein
LKKWRTKRKLSVIQWKNLVITLWLKNLSRKKNRWGKSFIFIFMESMQGMRILLKLMKLIIKWLNLWIKGSYMILSLILLIAIVTIIVLIAAIKIKLKLISTKIRMINWEVIISKIFMSNLNYWPFKINFHAIQLTILKLWVKVTSLIRCIWTMDSRELISRESSRTTIRVTEFLWKFLKGDRPKSKEFVLFLRYVHGTMMRSDLLIVTQWLIKSLM